MFTLDTNTLIYYFKGVGNIAKLLLATPPREISLSAIVLYELEVGIAKSIHPNKRRTQLDAFVSLITLLPFDDKVAKTTAGVRAKLEKKGTPLGPIDTLIAGTALANGSILVTHNVKEFSKVEGLKWIDWY